MPSQYCFKIMKLKELYDNYLNVFEQNKGIVSNLDFIHASVDSNDTVFCLFDNLRLIAILSVQKMGNHLLENQYLVVDKDYRRQRLAEFLLTQQFAYAKEHRLALVNSKYSVLGEKYLCALNHKLAKEYGVLFFEYHEPYEEVMHTFDASAYQWDTLLKWEQEVYWKQENELFQQSAY
jgi:GNAT superfamily N-acetyltransferase